MKEALERLKKAEHITDLIDQAWDQEPENEKLEAAWQDAYEKEYTAFNSLAEAIVKYSLGKIDVETACSIIRVKRADLETIIYKLS